MQRTLELSFDRLVIGSDLNAFAYCFVHRCPAIYLRVLSPYRYDRYETYDCDSRLWNDLAFALNSENLLPFADKIVSLRLEQNVLKAVTKYGLVISLSFKQLIISDDYLLEGMPPPINKTSHDNWVIDWFNIKHGGIHEVNEITDDENSFIKKIYFYISNRTYINKTKKDCLTVSLISDKELASGEYDENMARLKSIKMMKENGVKGVWDKTNNYFVSPKLSSTKRDIYSLGKNVYNNLPDNIKMLSDSADDILKAPRNFDHWSSKLKIYGINR